MYEVEKIIKSRINKKGRKEYFIKWVGYDNTQNTWEPERNLINVKDLLTEFQSRQTKQNGQDQRNLRSKLAKNLNGYEEGKNYNGYIDQQDDQKLFDQMVQQQQEDDNPNNFNRKPRGRPPNQSSVTKRPLKNIQILGLNQVDNQGLVFKVLIDGNTQWVKRNFFIPEYMLQLIQFYESSLVLRKS